MYLIHTGTQQMAPIINYHLTLPRGTHHFLFFILIIDVHVFSSTLNYKLFEG